jgi:hypothetical protein
MRAVTGLARAVDIAHRSHQGKPHPSTIKYNGTTYKLGGTNTMAAGYPKGTLFGKPKGEVIKHPGLLHKKLHVPANQTIPKAKLNKAAHAGGKLGKEANLAKTMSKFHH